MSMTGHALEQSLAGLVQWLIDREVVVGLRRADELQPQQHLQQEQQLSIARFGHKCVNERAPQMMANAIKFWLWSLMRQDQRIMGQAKQ